jgi:DNA-binding SARP family transcriptional activator
MPGGDDGESMIVEGSTILCLLGGPFVIKSGRRLEIPEGSKRLLVLVAVNGGRMERRRAAGILWPDCDHDRAAGNLRSALWRLRGTNIDLLRTDKGLLYLDPEVIVDIRQLSRWATRVVDGRADESEIRQLDLNAEATELLPGWYDDWVVFERERLRQRLLHGIESSVRQLIAYGQFAHAVELALTAVRMEPLRESAQRVLIEAHLAERNFVEARRVYAAYHELLTAELGVPPSDKLVETLRAAGQRHV